MEDVRKKKPHCVPTCLISEHRIQQAKKTHFVSYRTSGSSSEVSGFEPVVAGSNHHAQQNICWDSSKI
jgi:hypothetical protein